MKKIFIFSLFTSILLANEFTIKSFGTLGGVYNDNKAYYFRKDGLHKDGSAGSIYYGTDSVLGLQSSYNLTDELSCIVQGIYQKDYKDTYVARIDWAHFKYDTQNNITFKIGRLRNNFYRNSNNQNIGYSTLKIREHTELYGQFPFTSYNGAEIGYTNILDDYFYQIQASYGHEKFIAPIHSLGYEMEVEMDNLSSLNFTFGTDEANLRFTYMQSTISAKHPKIQDLFQGLRLTGLNELADEYDLTNKDSRYISAGLNIDKNDFILNAEYGYRRVPGFYVDMTGYYATSGYRINNLIPYISYAKSKMDQKISVDGSSNQHVNALSNFLTVQNLAQRTQTLGFKYFINKNLDFKMQYDRITPIGTLGGVYIPTVPNNYPSTKLHVTSFAFDFIF